MVTGRDIDRYVKEARNASQLLCNTFSTKYPLAAWIQVKNPQSGSIGNEFAYCFHGHGCTFSRIGQDNYELNLDYWNDNIILNPNKIHLFVKGCYTDDISLLESINKLLDNDSSIFCKETMYGMSRMTNIFLNY
nr:hypothetical protein NG677_04575 [Methylobacterium sp. OTU13CASTA1]